MVVRRKMAMPKAARRYDIYLPLNHNDGRPTDAKRFDFVEERLLERFGGVTSLHRQFPLRGIWRNDKQVFLDLVVIFTAFDYRKRGSAAFIASLKRDILHDFEQLEIMITESDLRIH